MRELKRRQREAGEAEQDLVEFVKRKRSLEQQMALEMKLLETARESEGNLTRFLETRRAVSGGGQRCRPEWSGDTALPTGLRPHRELA